MKNKKSKKPLILTIICVAIAAFAVTAFFVLRNSEEEPNPYANPEDSFLNRPDQPSDEPSHVPDNQLPEQPTTPAPGESLSVTITQASTTPDGILHITSRISSILESGTCHLTLTHGNTTITREADIFNNPQSATCQGFAIPTDELSSGTWQINLRVTSGDSTGLANTEVSI
ncbi:hypothetical protein FWD07_02085 [Candidatus Saccharibacteria bacterium]|nr:hypothetical protein [Candidatus Saccharibacteria bacterium]